MLSVPWLENLKTNPNARTLAKTLLPTILALAALKTAHSFSRKKQRVSDASESSTAMVPRTLLSREAFSYLLAFVAGWYDVLCFQQYKCYANMMTGNTLNMLFKLGNFDFGADTQILAMAIANFCGGFTLFKYADHVLNGRYSCSLFAPVVLALFGAADHYRLKHPSSRAPLLFLAVAGGIINSVSAEKAKAATNMMTGHYQKLSSDLADLMAEGATPQQKASAAHSVKICLTFWAAVTVGMASYNVKHGFKVLSQRKFSIVGGLYALLLLLHDAPAGQRKKLL